MQRHLPQRRRLHQRLPVKRERQVLELMATGYAKKDVAAEPGVSYNAVAFYTANIYEKLQVSNIAAAVSDTSDDREPLADAVANNADYGIHVPADRSAIVAGRGEVDRIAGARVCAHFGQIG